MNMNNYILSIEDGGFEARARVPYDPHIVRPLSLPNHLRASRGKSQRMRSQLEPCTPYSGWL